MADQPQTRMSTAETDIRVLQTDAVTTAKLLNGIAENQKETVRALEALRLSQYPPFSDVMKMAGIVTALVASALTMFFYLVDNRINEKTLLVGYRVEQIEKQVVTTMAWKNTTVVEKASSQ